MEPKPIIELKDVSFKYNESAEQLKYINLTINEGECVVITGPSGCGKTTLTRLINGLIPNFYEGELTGTVVLQGRNIKDIAAWDFGRIVGSVFQDSRSQFFTSVVQDEIAFCGENYGMDAEQIRKRVEELAEEMQLTSLLHSGVHQLSSGQKQKVAVASARLANPDILVMDEPSANLDMVATRELADILSVLKASRKSIIVADHRLYYLLPLADRIVYMNQGEIAAEWTPEELLSLSEEMLHDYGLRSPVLKVPSHVVGDPGCIQPERIALHDVRIAPKKFKRAVLDRVTFSLRKGEVVCMTGPNGVGKTTLARTLCGLLKEQKGYISIDEQPVKAKQRLGKLWFVMQDSDYQLFSDSVLNELLLSHEKESDAARRAEHLLKQLDLWAFRDQHPASLSGGQKQRLTFAVGLMSRPDILILDEPTSGLDGKNMRRVVNLIREIAATGVTVIVITHDYELVYGACERLLFFQENTLKLEMKLTEKDAPTVIQLMDTLRAVPAG
ncbi:energy-coupling factor ABC transporter ATP-binding protein [Paenibacillus sp. 481]|nr:energy-coupling factor ABC transporter ATP-binding protein [Paenibacillus sp. 481]